MRFVLRLPLIFLVLFSFLLQVQAKESKKSLSVKEKEVVSQEEKVDSYHLQQTDVIRMTVYQEDDMTTEAQISKSGTVSFPLIGSVMLKGLTVREAEQKVTELYKKDYLVNPRISLVVVSYAKKWITVSGAVETPGNIPYPEEGTVNLSSAIAMAGGVMENGNSSNITVARKKGGTSKYSLTAGAKVTLYPGDTVVVPRLPSDEKRIPTCTISGEVRNPGNIPLVDGKVDILTAIAMAGGFSKIANHKEAILQKKVKGGHRVVKVSLKNISSGNSKMVFLYPGDILIIKESIF